MRAVTLNSTKAGMTRLREKGGASPETLYELTNGYVNASRAATQRPGTRWKFTFPANTKGLVAFKGKLYAFASTVIDSGSSDYIVATLRHPSEDFTGQIADIHYAQPFLGYLYVVAEFDDGAIFHYWLRDPQAWIASHPYLGGDMVQPTTPNGYYYQATTLLTPPAWAPGVKRAVGDVIQPTTSNGWKYTVTAVVGDSPTSGATEPDWPTTDGATITEYVQAAPPPPPPSAPPGGGNPGGGNPGDGGRYGNPGGAGGGGGVHSNVPHPFARPRFQ